MDAPMSSPDKPLKRLEFKDVAPPQRPESPAFVRSSPVKPPVETQTAGGDTAGSPESSDNTAGLRLKSFDDLGKGLAGEKDAADEGELKHVAPLQDLEAGGEAQNSEVVSNPQNMTLGWNSAIDWGYTTAPLEGLNGRRIFAERGKTLGGSSELNHGRVADGGHAFRGWRYPRCPS